VEVQFESNKAVAHASLDNVTFAPPPLLHSIELTLDSA
jgi:hypothetical protein